MRGQVERGQGWVHVPLKDKNERMGFSSKVRGEWEEKRSTSAARKNLWTFVSTLNLMNGNRTNVNST